MSKDTKITVDATPGMLNGPGAVRILIGRSHATDVRLAVNTADGKSVELSSSAHFLFGWWPSGAAPTSVDGVLGSNSDATTRSHALLTVRHDTLNSRAIAVLSIRVVSQASRSSRSRVKWAPGRANGTPSTTTP